MTIAETEKKLETILTPKRYVHSVNVMNTSRELAERYGADVDLAVLAGLLHDCARDLDKNEILEYCRKNGVTVDDITRRKPELLHGQAGAVLAEECFEVDDCRVLEAISVHTMGSSSMSLLDRVVFVADYIEPARNYPGVEAIRQAAEINLERAMLMGIDNTIAYLLDKGSLVHPNTVITRNWVLTDFMI